MSGASEEREILAGEFVLGLLDPQTAAEVRAAARGDPVLAAAIASWEARLDPLYGAVRPVPPTDLLWARIEGGMGERPQSERAAPTVEPIKAFAPLAPRPQRPTSPRVWPRAAGATLLAACLGLFLAWSRPWERFGPTVNAVAVLSAPGELHAALRAQVLAGGQITLAPLDRLSVPPGRHMAFWAWPREAPAPILLGAIGEGGGRLSFPFAVRDGTPVMVTSEPPGDAAPGTPGPTLYAGLLALAR